MNRKGPHEPIRLYCYACDEDLMLLDDENEDESGVSSDGESASDSSENASNQRSRQRRQQRSQDMGNQSMHHSRSSGSGADVQRGARRGIPPTSFPPPNVCSFYCI